MSIIVQKFGGTSVANADRINAVADRVINTYKNGNSVVAVVSAQGDTTDDLIEKAQEINPNCSKREMDMLLSTGEQISASLLAMAIQKKGYPVVSLNSYQIGLHTNSNYGNSRIKSVDTERLELELDRKNIVIATGFQGINKYDDITTLGRGGSDTTAVAIAVALKADLCEIYTDVDGVYTADPRVVKDAKKLQEISYDEMLELASLGAKVLHNRSVELAKKYSINLVVRSSFNYNEGTLVREVKEVESMLIKGVTSDEDVARISVVGVADKPGVAFKLFGLLSKEKIDVDVIIQSIGRDGKKDISFTVSEENLSKALEIINANKGVLSFENVTYTDKVAKISLVGAGMVNNPGIAANMFEALYEASVNVDMISTSEIKISVLIDEKDISTAVNAIHKKFMLSK